MRRLLLTLLLASSLYAQDQGKADQPIEVTSASPAAPETKKSSGDIDILSDTEGVDFHPYLSTMVTIIRKRWYSLVPDEARKPLVKTGIVAIDFVILKDGTLGGEKIVRSAGEIPLDRAAWDAIKSSAPFPTLPEKFGGKYLALRIHFSYNPQKKEDKNK
jgi:TonB family protein